MDETITGTSTIGATTATATVSTTAPSAKGPTWPVDYNAYKLIGKVGQGAFATVWRAECSHCTIMEQHSDNNSITTGGVADGNTANNINNTNETTKEEVKKMLCAIKILDLEHVDTNFGDIRLEVQTMRLSSHPNILSIYTSFIQSSNLWLVMQLMNKGSSLHCLQSIRMKYHKYNYKRIKEHHEHEHTIQKTEIKMENHITYILHETLLGLKYIHENGQIHRDIKAGNILLDSLGNVRIADFGVSGWLVDSGSKRENTRTFVGTPCWMAPEVMEQITGYDTKADIWSLGITALELAKGYAPYAKYPPMKVLLLTIQEDPPSLDTYLNYDDAYDSYDEEESDDLENEVIMNEEWSQSFQAMIKICLQKSPKERPNCEELLQHEHFKSLSLDSNRNEYRNKIVAEILDQIDNVGTSNATVKERGKRLQSNSCHEPICIVPSENIPAGTTWIFEDGSHVSSSRLGGSDDVDNQEFLSNFESATQGENFRHPSIKEHGDEGTKVKQNEHDDKDDLNAFMDELETLTSGENYKK